MPKDGLKSTVLRADIEDGEGEAEPAGRDPERASGEGRCVEQLDEEELVDRYEGLVGRIARDIYDDHAGNVPFDDLRAYGFQGLLEARGSFDSGRGVSFSTFAFYRIRGAIYDGLRQEGWSRRDQGYGVAARAAVNEHLADHAESRSTLPRSKTFKDSIEHLDRMVGDSITVLLVRQLDLEELRITGDEVQFDDFDRRQRLDLVEEALEQLDDNERTVVTRYHLKDDSMSAIGEELGYSKGWISRVNGRAIEKIRAYITKNTERLSC